MKKVVIYEDNEKKIEILEWADYLIRHLTPQQFKLSDNFIERMVPLVYAKLSAKGVEIKTPKDRAYSNVAPIFAYGTGVVFKEPFDVFENAQEIVCAVKDIRADKDFIQEAIEFYNSTTLPDNTNIYF